MIFNLAFIGTKLTVLDVHGSQAVEPLQNDLIMHTDILSERGSCHTDVLPLKRKNETHSLFLHGGHCHPAIHDSLINYNFCDPPP